MRPLDQCFLYTFVDTAYLRGRSAGDVARQLCEGGSDMVQLRAKGCAPAEIERLAAEVGPVLRQAGVNFVLNDHWEIARDVGADYCHLGQEDFFERGYNHVNQLPHREDGRRAEPRLGLSTHAPDQAIRALKAEPAYVAIGPIYATQTKPGARPVSLEYAQWAAKEVQIPWFAIGGITLDRLDAVLEAGGRRICVVSAILDSVDITAACSQFKRRIEAASPGGKI